MRIGNDKWKHAVAGTATWAVAVALGSPAWAALASAAMVGAGKELWDRSGHGVPDRMDFAATVALPAAMTAWMYLVGAA